MTESFFKGQTLAAAYYKFRPNPPASLTKRVLDYLLQESPPTINGKWPKALDVGCGSGQGTLMLAPYFNSVSGCDVSQDQIDQANDNNFFPNISYKVSQAETLNFPSASVTLVTSGQAAHWFDLPKFYAEVDRILVKGGVVVVYGYDVPKIVNHPKKKILSDLIVDVYKVKLAGCFGPQLSLLLESRYCDPVMIPPYPSPVRDEKHCVDAKVTLKELEGYMSSWSGYAEYCKRHGQEKGQSLLEEFTSKMIAEMGVTTAPEDTLIEIQYDFFLNMARKPR